MVYVWIQMRMKLVNLQNSVRYLVPNCAQTENVQSIRKIWTILLHVKDMIWRWRVVVNLYENCLIKNQNSKKDTR